MSSVAKVIIKDKFTGKLIALKLKEETLLQRVISILQKRYPHLEDKNISLYFQDEELNLEYPLYQFIQENNYTEKDRIEVREKVEEEIDFVAMMSKGGKNFDRAVSQILVEEGVIDEDIAQSLLGTSAPFVTSLIEQGYVEEKTFLHVISSRLDVSHIDLEKAEIALNMLNIVPKDIADHYCVLPIRQEGNSLSVAVSNPFNAEKLHDLGVITGREIEPFLSTEYAINKKYRQLYEQSAGLAEMDMAQDDDFSGMEIGEEAVGMEIGEDDFTGMEIGEDDFSGMEIGGEEELPDERPAEALQISSDFEDTVKRPKRATLIIENGKKLDINELPSEKCDAPTIWEDKNDDELEPEPMEPDVDPEIEAGESVVSAEKIWDAPTFIAPKSEELLRPIEDEEDHDEDEDEDNEMGIDLDNLLADNSKGKDKVIGEELPIYGGMNPAEISETLSEPDLGNIDGDLQLPEDGVLDPTASEDEFEAEDDKVMKMTEEEMDLERTIRNELLDSHIIDSFPKGKSRESITIPADTKPVSLVPNVMNQPGQALEQLESQSQTIESEAQTIEPETIEPETIEPETIAPKAAKQAPVAKPAASQPAASAQPVVVHAPQPPRSVFHRIKRNILVRYYSRMNPFKTFPLDVTLSSKEIEKKKSRNMAQSSPTTVEISSEKPMLKVVGHIPGCLVTPSETIVDVTPETTNVKLWITPMASGKIQDAHVQIWHDNKCIKKIPLSMKISTQKASKFSVACGFALPVLTFLYEVFGTTILLKSPQVVYDLLKNLQDKVKPIGGMFHLGLIAGMTFMVLGLVFYLVKNKKQASPIEDVAQNY